MGIPFRELQRCNSARCNRKWKNFLGRIREPQSRMFTFVTSKDEAAEAGIKGKNCEG